nr:hypothetical protein CFP56_32257 [Quercus suber]
MEDCWKKWAAIPSRLVEWRGEFGDGVTAYQPDKNIPVAIEIDSDSSSKSPSRRRRNMIVSVQTPTRPNPFEHRRPVQTIPCGGTVSTSKPRARIPNAGSGSGSRSRRRIASFMQAAGSAGDCEAQTRSCSVNRVRGVESMDPGELPRTVRRCGADHLQRDPGEIVEMTVRGRAHLTVVSRLCAARPPFVRHLHLHRASPCSFQHSSPCCHHQLSKVGKVDDQSIRYLAVLTTQGQSIPRSQVPFWQLSVPSLHSPSTSDSP